MLDKSKYHISEVIEGERFRLTEIKVMKLDSNPICNEEIKDLLSEFERIFPSNIYRIRYETKPVEDDVVLHIYLNLTTKEAFRRSRIVGKRIIVPKVEVEKHLRNW